MNYYVMVGEGKYPVAPIAEEPVLPGGPWYEGAPLSISVPNPMIYTLKNNREKPGNLKALYDEKSMPVMRDDLVEALTTTGVDNVEYFPALIRDPMTGAEHANYKAFNVLGAVAAANMGASKLMGTSSSVWIDADFDSLALDPEAARGLLLFRLAENVSAIVVHERVKQEVEKRNIPGIVFYASGEWSG